MKVRTIREYERVRRVSDTEEGEEVRQMAQDLEKLIAAYEAGAVQERGA